MQESAFQRSNAAEQGSAAFRLQLPELDIRARSSTSTVTRRRCRPVVSLITRNDVSQLVNDVRDVLAVHKLAVARKAALNLNIIFSIFVKPPKMCYLRVDVTCKIHQPLQPAGAPTPAGCFFFCAAKISLMRPLP